MKPNPLPPLDLLEGLLYYESETGEVRWVKSRGSKKAGSKAGSLNQNGYLIVQVNKRLCYLHRLAWVLYHREELTPDEIIDHIDGDKTNNRIDNLRKVTHSENNLNRTYKPNISGFRGVSYNKNGKKKFQVKLGFDYFGCYETAEEANEVRQRVERERGGFFR